MRFLALVRVVIWSTALLILPNIGYADPDSTADSGAISEQSLRLSGFGTAGYVAGGNDELYFVRDWSQAATNQTNTGFVADSRLGVQANYTINPDWAAVVQMVSRYKAQPTWADAVEWAFLSYHPSTDSTIRVGRMGMDVFALSDYRNVGYAYTWVRPPTEFYGWIPIYSIDGADIATNINSFDSLIRPKFFVGSGKATIPTTGGDFNFQANAAFGTSILMEHDVWRFRLSYVHMKVGSSFPFSALTNPLQEASPVWTEATNYADQLNIYGSSIKYSAAALNYDDGNWQLQSEFSHTVSESEFMPDGNRGYISLGRRFNDWLPFINFSKSTDPVHPNVVAPPGFGLEPLASETNYVLNLNRLRQYTWSLGVRWDFAPNMAWKLQADRSKISDPGAALWDVISPTWSGGSRTLLSSTFDFVF